MKKFKELHQKSIAELRALLAEKRKELVKTRFDLASKKIKDVHKGKFIRKEIARVLTIVREKELMSEEKEGSL